MSITDEWLAQLKSCKCGNTKLYRFLARGTEEYFLGCEKCKREVSSHDQDGRGLKRCIDEWNERFSDNDRR